MTISYGGIFRYAAFALLVGVVVVECGVLTNESQSVSVSSSVSSKAKPITEEKKPSRVGKVLYTAPYSTVRLSKNEGKSLFPSSAPSPKFRAGPVLIKKGEEVPTTATYATTTTTTVSTTPVPTTTTSSSTTTTPSTVAPSVLVTEEQVIDTTTGTGATTVDVVFS